MTAPATAATQPAAGTQPSIVTLPTASTAKNTQEERVFALINKKRAAKNLRALKSQSKLDATARAWAKHLAKTGAFKHSTSSWRLKRINWWGWSASGENLAAGYTTATSTVKGWMSSSGHRANILGKSYKGMGVGYAKGGPYGHYWVVIFAVADPAIKAGKTPTISGTRAVGSTLTAKTSGWPKGTRLHWQWYRNGVKISGATSSKYKAKAADEGKKLKVRVAGYHKKYYPKGLTSKSTAALE
ncbi:MAG: CAP domain-containing protein [Microbacterium sp.]|uniref:CAP domain-containing protein n=1 Tax=Microbacterium sp. TaxID=51671 RepID=UPI0039E4075B